MPLVETPYRYSVYEDDEYGDACILFMYDWQHRVFDLTDEWDLETLAQACAEEYRGNGGYELTEWANGSTAIDMFIWVDETTKIKFEVWLDYEPTFKCTRRE